MGQETNTREYKKYKKESQVREIWRRFRKSRVAMIGLILLACIILVAIFADVITPYERAIEQHGADRFTPPCGQYLFGTDHLGRDMFARIVHGSRYSLLIGVSTVAAAMLLGLLIVLLNILPSFRRSTLLFGLILLWPFVVLLGRLHALFIYIFYAFYLIMLCKIFKYYIQFVLFQNLHMVFGSCRIGSKDLCYDFGSRFKVFGHFMDSVFHDYPHY